MKYKIFQMKHSEQTRGIIFTSYETAMINKPNLSLKDYDMVYSGDGILTVRDDSDALDNLYNVFNVRHPNDFKGRSMSVSDIIDLDGRMYYVEPFGYKRISENFKEITEGN